ncbi:MAG TPA: thioredoxin family protein [Cyclobacteriaceae bacterium]|nr:thioredoxin family protein [Cyclobacteriaceae bacterium]
MIRSMLIVAVCMFVLVAASPVRTGYEVGDTVADFKLKNTNGKMVALSDYKDVKGVIVIFDCNTCPYSQAWNTRIIALNKKYASQKFPVVLVQPNDPAISQGDSYEKMIEQAENKGYDFPYLFDETQTVAKTFGATNTPHVYVLKKEGAAFKVSYIGAIDDNARNESAVTKRYVEDAVDALLGSKAVPTAKTKALGCTIKWKNS